jgi:L-histidine Nalpha-methyltransferase
MMLSDTRQTDTAGEFAVAVANSLRQVGQRELPSAYLYDELGTALFEAITVLPEYGLTRAEERLLRRHAGDMLGHLPPPVAVIELGSGSGRKTRWILEALAAREPVAYFPIDISAAALIKCRQELGHIGALSIVGLETSYLEGLEEAADSSPAKSGTSGIVPGKHHRQLQSTGSGEVSAGHPSESTARRRPFAGSGREEIDP